NKQSLHALGQVAGDEYAGSGCLHEEQSYPEPGSRDANRNGNCCGCGAFRRSREGLRVLATFSSLCLFYAQGGHPCVLCPPRPYSFPWLPFLPPLFTLNRCKPRTACSSTKRA